MKKSLNKYTLNNFKTPHGTINNAHTVSRPDGSDIISPHTRHSSRDTRGLHHHVYWDRRHENAIGLAYTRQANGKTWREYYIDKGHGWQRTGKSQKYNSVREMNRVSQQRAQQRKHQRQSASESIKRATQSKPKMNPKPKQNPNQNNNPNRPPNSKPPTSPQSPKSPKPPTSPKPPSSPSRSR